MIFMSEIECVGIILTLRKSANARQGRDRHRCVRRSPLRGLANVIPLPRVAGSTTDRWRDAGEFALRNLGAYTAGLPLEAVIQPADYDRVA